MGHLSDTNGGPWWSKVTPNYAVTLIAIVLVGFTIRTSLAQNQINQQIQAEHQAIQKSLDTHMSESVAQFTQLSDKVTANTDLRTDQMEALRAELGVVCELLSKTVQDEKRCSDASLIKRSGTDGGPGAK